MSEELKLLGAWFSPFVYIVKLALNFKGIQYENLEQDLIQKSELLKQSNPIHQKVPVLIHNGKPICDSQIIFEYLDDAWKENPLLPRDSYERAIARFWARFVNDKVTEMVRNVLIFDGEKHKDGIKQATEALEILEGELKGKKFFGGDTIGLVDIALGHMPNWLGAIEETCSVKINDSGKYPNLALWMKNFMELPLVKESMPPREDLVKCFNKLRPFVLARNAQERPKSKTVESIPTFKTQNSSSN